MYGWNVNISEQPALGMVAAHQWPAPACRHPENGVAAGVLVATKNGWCAIDSLQAGDLVHTLDDELQPIQEIRRYTLTRQNAQADPARQPMRIPEGTLGNTREMLLMPQQGLMIESENACDEAGDPFAVVPVHVLEGVCGIARQAQRQQTELYRLVLPQEAVVYADGGVLLHSPPADGQASGRYDVWSGQAARQMMTDLDLAHLLLDETGNDIYQHLEMGRVA